MDALQLAERHLTNERAYNASNSILPSENQVIDRLLSDRLEMAGVWEEMLKTSRSEDVFLAAIRKIVSVSAFYHPEKTKSSRESLRIANEQVTDIQKKAKELATLLKRHIALASRESIQTGVREHPAEYFDHWGCFSPDGNLYANHLREQLDYLRYSYDSKYWPTFADCLESLAEMCAEPVQSIDHTMAFATSAREASRGDFVRSIERILQEFSIHLSIKSMTSMMNCALGLVDDAVDIEWMKKTRQRIRKTGDN